MDLWFEGLLGAFGLVLFVAGNLWNSRRARSLLEGWTAQVGYRIVAARRRHLFMGPFSWTTGEGQVVYRITVELGAGLVRSGWVRFGGRPFGPPAEVEVRWDEAPAPELRGVEAVNPLHDRWLDG